MTAGFGEIYMNSIATPIEIPQDKNKQRPQENLNIREHLDIKRSQRLKIHKGILYHAGVENKKINPRSIIYNLEKMS